MTDPSMMWLADFWCWLRDHRWSDWIDNPFYDNKQYRNCVRCLLFEWRDKEPDDE